MQVVIKNGKKIADNPDHLFVDGLYGEDHIIIVPNDVEVPDNADEADIVMTQEQEEWSLVLAKVKEKEIADKIAKEDEAISDLKKDGKLPSDYTKPEKYKTKDKKVKP